jgi:hypothetical protein
VLLGMAGKFFADFLRPVIAENGERQETAYTSVGNPAHLKNCFVEIFTERIYAYLNQG